LEFHAWV